MTSSKLLDHFSHFLDCADEESISDAATLFAHFRAKSTDGFWSAAFGWFALTEKYDDKQQHKLRCGLAMAANDVAQDAPDAEVKFLLSVLEAAGYGHRSVLPLPEHGALRSDHLAGGFDRSGLSAE